MDNERKPVEDLKKFIMKNFRNEFYRNAMRECQRKQPENWKGLSMQ